MWTSLKWSSFSLKWPEIEAWNEVLKWKFMNFLKNQCLKGQVDHFIKNLELFENYLWLKNIIFVENYSKLWKWKILVIFHEHFWNNKFMVWHSKGLKFIEIWPKMKKMVKPRYVRKPHRAFETNEQWEANISEFGNAFVALQYFTLVDFRFNSEKLKNSEFSKWTISFKSKISDIKNFTNDK